MDSKKIGLFISKKRKEKNLSQQELASIINVSNKTISKWENGRGLPNVDILVFLCETLDCELIELLKGKEKVSKEEYNEVLLNNLKNKKKKFLLDVTAGVVLCIIFIIIEIFMELHSASDKILQFVFIIIFIILLLVDIFNYFNNKLK